MWKRFIDLGTALLFVVSTGCSSTPRVEPAAQGAPPVEVSRDTAERFQQALAAMRAERYSEAEVLFTELTVKEPELSGPWANLGLVYLRLDRPDAAEAALKEAVTVNPGNCAALNELGVLARVRGDFLTAESSYLACIRAHPDFPEAHLNLGILYELYLGRFSEALDAYRTFQVLSGAPDERVEGWMIDLQRRLVARRES